MARDLTRRTFAQRLAVLAAAPALPLAVPIPATGAPPAAPAPAAPPVAATGPEADALALAQVVHNRWGDRLTFDELSQVTQSIAASLRRAAELYTVPLANGDEPDFVFRVYRAAD